MLLMQALAEEVYLLPKGVHSGGNKDDQDRQLDPRDNLTDDAKIQRVRNTVRVGLEYKLNTVTGITVGAHIL